MRDILSQGAGREPSPWRRRVAVVAALLLVAVVLVWRVAGHRHSPAQPARAATTPGALPRAASGSAGLVPGLASQPNGVTGPALPWESSLRLPITGQQPTWFWPATGRVKPIGGLPRDGSGYQFVRLAGGWAVQASSGAQLRCGSCAGQPAPVYFLGDRASAVTGVGLADQVAAGPAAGTVWLTSYQPGADMSTAAGTAREVSISGAPIGPQISLPAGYVIDQATDHGLLLAPVVQRPGMAAYTLWDPAARQASRTFDGVIAASASEIAWVTRCAPLCQVQVLDLATGQHTTVELARASSAASGAFSPDGDFLAVEVSFRNGGDGGALATQLDVASLASGRLTAVPGTGVSSDALAGFGWPAGRDSLIAELSFMTKVQVASWQPGAARLAVAVVPPGQNPASLIVG
jgi:hypothetical protein